jgi:tRNA (guanine-N7-)-methyltransferase
MTPAQKRAREELFPRFGVSLEDLIRALAKTPERAEASLIGSDTVSDMLPAFLVRTAPEPPPPESAFINLFGNVHPVTVEIGFGMGIATAIIAERNPGKNYLGIEVFRPGVGRLLWEIGQRSLSNVRVIEHDAAEVLPCLPPCSLAGIHLFFPDPWPKKRHHKRRLVSRPFTELLASRLEPAGYLYMVTDWEDYAFWALEELSRTPGLENPWAGGAGGGFAPPQAWRPETKFEKKGIEEARRVWELYFTAATGPSRAAKDTAGRSA